MTYSKFFELFPDNDACLEYLKAKFFADGTECPKCRKASKFHRINGRSAYSCQFCGHHVYPTAGTIFHKTTVSLQLWFWAIYLMSSTRCGISAKQLEREIGVTYKTAHRMFKQIRTLLGHDQDRKLTGDVEIDETAGGAKHSRASDTRRGIAHIKKSQRPTIWAAVERGGEVRAEVVKSRSKPDIERPIHKYVLPSSMIFTDEHKSYDHNKLSKKYLGHHRIKHAAGIYVDGDVHTQTIEGFFGLFKTSVRGVYHAISTKYLQNYIDEYAFRYNRRFSEQPMFWMILDRVQKDRLAAPQTDSS